jgi:hypothetical protein
MIRHIVRDQMPNLHTVEGIPTESGRVHASEEAIRAWYADLAEKVRDVRREFLFNVDEMGFSQWSDAKVSQVIVPFEYDELTIGVPVNRSSQRRSMCVCIAADGSTMRHFIIIERQTSDEEMRLMGYTEDKIHLSFHQTAFMTKILWGERSRTVFFPDIARRREESAYPGRACVLLDGLTWHYTPAFLEGSADANVTVI